jgi:hypothetical protein
VSPENLCFFEIKDYFHLDHTAELTTTVAELQFFSDRVHGIVFQLHNNIKHLVIRLVYSIIGPIPIAAMKLYNPLGP